MDGNVQRLCPDCAAHLATLAALTHGSTPLTSTVTIAVRNTTTAVLGEAINAVASSQYDLLLSTRLTRLAAAAHDTVSAAESGDIARLQREARRFEVFASALWSVRQALPTPAPHPAFTGGRHDPRRSHRSP